MAGLTTAVLDACVLYPAPLRSLLMYLAVGDVFRARWSETIHAEWMRNVRRDYPDISEAQVQRIRTLMNSHVRECVVEGFEPLIPTLHLPDADDRHVLAAAVQSKAELIVTFNLADFPAEELGKYGIEAKHPDAFLGELLEHDPEGFCAAAREQRSSLKRPSLSVEQYLASLARQQLPTTVERLTKSFSDVL